MSQDEPYEPKQERIVSESDIELVQELLRLPAFQDVLAERKRQDAKWGEQNHDPFTYLTVLMEEVGELAQASLQTKFGGECGGLERMRSEAVQTAAVALAFVECLDRAKWTWPDYPEGTKA